ncbi:hypothetical protein J7E93_03735 [Streptomyces sp. ISL-36]|uniref:hypothetical protein n=1 Tax=Streptomyces sp. ISL-36 TaxID=2819182 RepID=UPI001BE9BD94|nr:hypothetical protein [Streptomyces sp. ISL-36]MBT2439244.1 hypothetical protein [Streptomyces sp. ISL-36]
MSMEKPPPRPEPEGCLTAFIRIPVRIVVLVIVVPVRMVWDVLVVAARAVDRTLLRPAGRALRRVVETLVVTPAAWLFRYLVAVPLGWLGRHVLASLFRGVLLGATWLARAVFVRPWVALWRYVLVPVVRYGLVIPAAWLYRSVLTPLGHGLAWLCTRTGRGLGWLLTGLWRYGVVPLVRYGFALPAGWLHARVLTPLGHALTWLFTGLGRALGWLARAVFVWPWVALWRYVVVPVARYGIAIPVAWLWRRVLAPVGREVVDALRVCWRIAGYISRAVGRAVKWLARNLVGRPVAWFYTSVARPVGHWVRDSLWAPARRAAAEAGRVARAALSSARETVRQARRDAWHALVGGARVTEPGEPVVASTRTLGSTTSASGAAPAPEISLRKRG